MQIKKKKKLSRKKKWIIASSVIGGSLVIINSCLWIPYAVNYLNIPGERFVNAQGGWAKDVDGQSWMSHIDPNKSLSKINIPCGHDAGTKNISFIPWTVSTQAYSIEDQLNAGIRFLDVRVVTDKVNSNRWYINHGPGECSDDSGNVLYYDAVEGIVHNFLIKHPSETVFMSVFPRDDPNFDKKKFLDCSFNDQILDKQDYYYRGLGIPTLAQSQGKIIMVHRFDLELADGSFLPPFGIDTSSWSKNDVINNMVTIGDDNSNYTGIVQDNWSNHNPKDKWYNCIKPCIDKVPQPSNDDKDFIFINGFNAQGSPFNYGPLPYPRFMAKQINDAFLKTTLNYKQWYGWYFLDSYKGDLSSNFNIARKLYVTNEFFR